MNQQQTQTQSQRQPDQDKMEELCKEAAKNGVDGKALYAFMKERTDRLIEKKGIEYTEVVEAVGGFFSAFRCLNPLVRAIDPSVDRMIDASIGIIAVTVTVLKCTPDELRADVDELMRAMEEFIITSNAKEGTKQ